MTKIPARVLVMTVGTGDITRLEESLFTPLRKSIATDSWTRVILLPSGVTAEFAQRLACGLDGVEVVSVCQKIPSSARSLRRTATLSAKFRPNFGPATGRTDTTEGCSASYRFAFSTSGHRRPFPPPYAGPGGEVRR